MKLGASQGRRHTLVARMYINFFINSSANRVCYTRIIVAYVIEWSEIHATCIPVYDGARRITTFRGIRSFSLETRDGRVQAREWKTNRTDRTRALYMMRASTVTTAYYRTGS